MVSVIAAQAKAYATGGGLYPAGPCGKLKR